MRKFLLLVCIGISITAFATEVKSIPITVENNSEGAPITIGLPFAKGELFSVDNVRLLDANGTEVLCQTTKVSTWAPIDESVKWIWVFFFTGSGSEYMVEYGEGVTPLRPETKIVSINNMRPGGGIYVNTGPLSFTIDKSGNGFLDKVLLDSNGDGDFGEDEILATSQDGKRGTFLDILDDVGVDASKAIMHEVFREKSSGPMHTIFRVEGTQINQREDNNNSPFTLRIHAYAGKSFIRILHTMTYTGIPDKHKIQEGEHANIATQNKFIMSEDTAEDKGWTQPNDRISSCGLSLGYFLDDNAKVSMPLINGDWQVADGDVEFPELSLFDEDIDLLQEGPERGSGESLRDYYMNKSNKKKAKTRKEKAIKFTASVLENGNPIVQMFRRRPPWSIKIAQK